jgi:MerR family copper efflux transcriptional regulator
MHIGNVAERSGVPAKTIRYYESIGLIPSAARTPNGYRIYDDLDLRTLQFIQRARSLSFPVSEVASLLALWHDRSRASAEVKLLAQKRIAHVERKIEELQAIKRALLDLAERCQGDDRPDCPIIDELAGRPTDTGLGEINARGLKAPQ